MSLRFSSLERSITAALVLVAGAAAGQPAEAPGAFADWRKPGRWRMELEIRDEAVPPEVLRKAGSRDEHWAVHDLETISKGRLEAEFSICPRQEGGAEIRFRVVGMTSEVGIEGAVRRFKPFSFVALRDANGHIASVHVTEGRADPETVDLYAQISWASHCLLFGAPSVWLVEGREPDSVALRMEDIALDVWKDAPGGRIGEGQVQWPPPKYLCPASIDEQGRLTFVGMSIKPKPRDWSFWRAVYDPSLGCVVEIERERLHIFQSEHEMTPLSEAEALLKGDAVRVQRQVLRATITLVEDEDKPADPPESKPAEAHGQTGKSG
jgi:hypothetical protein